ncbi:MAG: 50S ribosomal protein L17 [Anaerolinea sp.]|nr:50S ribosomal protein L17 [Anaerolinea sp.]MCC6972691.1 50S ribosomal protein L17 [Anaerolineae bacterium]CAG0970600.1 50S ribosomal protein L17 [Planctomycetaceae bacterium]
MRHRVKGKLLGRSVGQRNALRRTMVTQLLTHERITTTRTKADAIRGAAEQMITQVKRSLSKGDAAYQVHIRRLLNGRLDDPQMVSKLFDVLAPRYMERPGGYTRIYRLGPRKGDGAEMVVLELVDRPTDGGSQPAAGLAGRAGGLLSRIRGGRRGQDKPAESGESSS